MIHYNNDDPPMSYGLTDTTLSMVTNIFTAEAFLKFDSNVCLQSTITNRLTQHKIIRLDRAYNRSNSETIKLIVRTKLYSFGYNFIFLYIFGYINISNFS